MSGRVDREIEEILLKYEKVFEKRRRARRSVFGRLSTRLRRLRLTVRAPGGGQLMLGGLLAILFAYFFAAFLPESVKEWLLIGGVVTFAVGLLLAVYRNWRHPRAEMRWRGRVIRVEDRGFRARVRGWFHRKNGY